jgi:ArsR family transcriptional regulator, cadmium/lead-responsive transcriptional repressor
MRISMSQQLIATQNAMPTAPELAAKFFRGVGDPTRIKILQILLEEGDKNVTELVEMLGSPQGRVSSHLACLRGCGSAMSYRNGKNVYYTISDPRIREILQLAQQILQGNAQRVLACEIIK